MYLDIHSHPFWILDRLNTTLQNISVFTSYCIDCAYVSCYKRSKILYMLFKEKYKQTRYLYNTWLHCSIDRFFSLLSFSSVFILLVCLFKIICFQLCNRIIQQYYDYIVQNWLYYAVSYIMIISKCCNWYIFMIYLGLK